MKVILLENIMKIGNIGDIIDVKRGYARNFLISKKKALFASKKNISDVEKINKELSEKLNNKIFEIKKLSTENDELYGSVKPTEISKLISQKENIDINSSIIQPIKEIKSIGKFKININLHAEIQATIYLDVSSDEKNK